MITSETKIKVRYNEVDRMGYLHHSIYTVYLEIARTNLFRDFGLTYKKFEDSGIFMPVYSLTLNYKKPAFYDDELIIKTFLKETPEYKLKLDYEIYNQQNELLCTAKSVNAFIQSEKKRPITAPKKLIDSLKLLK